jgi:hypothetical protein
MLPPIDPTVLSTNPQFYILYRDLCTVKLNLDGSSTLDQKTQKDRDVFATVSGNSFLSKWSRGSCVWASSPKFDVDSL